MGVKFGDVKTPLPPLLMISKPRPRRNKTPRKSSHLPFTDASVKTWQVSFQEAADTKEPVANDTFIIYFRPSAFLCEVEYQSASVGCVLRTL